MCKNDPPETVLVRRTKNIMASKEKPMAPKPFSAARLKGAGQPAVSKLETVLVRRAQRLGVPVEELRAHDRKALRASRADRIDCLDPYEVEQLWSGELEVDRTEHIAQCAMCSSLVDVSRPSEEGFTRLMRSLASEAQPAADARPRRNIKQTLKELGLIELGVAAALGLGYAALSYFGQDNITAAVFRENPSDFAQPILAMAIVPMLFVVIWQFFGPNGSGQGVWTGRVVGGVFATFVFGYLGFAAWNLNAAQSSLVATIAHKSAKGQVAASSVFTASVPAVSGVLVAEKTTESFQFYWDDGDSRMTVGTAYVGQLERASNGNIKLRASTRDIELKQTRIVQSAADVGRRAVALVPLNSTRPAGTLGLVDLK